MHIYKSLFCPWFQPWKNAANSGFVILSCSAAREHVTGCFKVKDKRGNSHDCLLQPWSKTFKHQKVLHPFHLQPPFLYRYSKGESVMFVLPFMKSGESVMFVTIRESEGEGAMFVTTRESGESAMFVAIGESGESVVCHCQGIGRRVWCLSPSGSRRECDVCHCRGIGRSESAVFVPVRESEGESVMFVTVREFEIEWCLSPSGNRERVQCLSPSENQEWVVFVTIRESEGESAMFVTVRESEGESVMFVTVRESEGECNVCHCHC